MIMMRVVTVKEIKASEINQAYYKVGRVKQDYVRHVLCVIRAWAIPYIKPW